MHREGGLLHSIRMRLQVCGLIKTLSTPFVKANERTRKDRDAAFGKCIDKPTVLRKVNVSFCVDRGRIVSKTTFHRRHK